MAINLCRIVPSSFWLVKKFSLAISSDLKTAANSRVSAHQLFLDFHVLALGLGLQRVFAVQITPQNYWPPGCAVVFCLQWNETPNQPLNQIDTSFILKNKNSRSEELREGPYWQRCSITCQWCRSLSLLSASPGFEVRDLHHVLHTVVLSLPFECDLELASQ